MNRLLALLMLALLAAAAAPSAAPAANAALPPPPGFTQCYNYQWDSDHDGTYESWHTCGTPPCGCYCPVVGMVLTLHTGESERMVGVWASCQSGYGTAGESGDGSYGATVTPILYPAGLGPVFDEVRYILDSSVCTSC